MAPFSAPWARRAYLASTPRGYRGSGIFLHVNGRGATTGCVSAPRRFLRMLVRHLDPAAVPVIAIGP